MNTKKFNKKNVLMVAHRGLSGIEPENTNFAFVAAGNRSYYGIETDIHCTKDGNFILTHDDSAVRVSGVDTVIEETDFSVLREIKLFDKGGSADREDLRMPTLEEYLRICKTYEKECVLELKNHMEETDVRCIIDRIEAEGYMDHVIFISFDFENLIFVRNYRPAQRVQFLFKQFTDEIISNVKTYRMDIDVRHTALTEAIIREMHEAGLLVNCWTVDDPADAERLVDWGVDFITTNVLE